MENALDAMKMAFGMLVFVMCLSVVMRVFSLAKETADIVLERSDSTFMAEYQQATNQRIRTVGLETIIPSLYKYYKEDYMVVFQRRNGSPYKLYTTQTNSDLWSSSYADIWNSNYDPEKHLRFNDNQGKDIASFDLEQETARREPWTGNADVYFKRNLDAIIHGGEFVYPDNSGRTYDYSNLIGVGGLIAKFRNTSFDEYIGEYTFQTNENIAQVMTNRTKRVIIYRER